ncbi:ABC transporter permease YtrF precursor [Caulifigura coniformis]|uniref:ABC transporter permease YtrF n=1 Tax=Caulifigura coniformis TaxID=2527983 RepID=A0A517S922_9PLAN|nr:ABC transporter permease [Caulifigura coniformis]QDT52631.1 ABC transporter permease YtrF precursor [Caulifigura coniformis]
MNLTWKLFIAQARHQKVRLALTALAMVAAVGVVLWVVSAYETIASRFDEQTEEFVGNYDVFVVPRSIEDSLSPELTTRLEHDPVVAAANPVAQFRMMFRKAEVPKPADQIATQQAAGSPPGRGLGRMGPMVVGTSSLEPRYPLSDGRWLAAGTTQEAVVSSGVAEALALKPGDGIEFRIKPGDVLKLTVVGITEQVDEVEFAMTRTKGGAPGGTNRGPASLAAYVPLDVIEDLTGAPAKLNLVELRLKPDAKADQLASTVGASNPAAELLRPEDVKAKLSGGFAAQAARKQAYFVTALSILASAFIIFTTLSMGVNERARQLAVLRAVGLKRSQVARLVLMEALALALLGWVGGLVGGWLLLKGLAAARPAMFPHGVTLGGSSVVLTGACSLAGALLASIFPIWKATRISPLEAMAPVQIAPRRSHWYIAVAAVSFLLIAINPVLTFLPTIDESLRFVLILAVGVPATVAGFVLLAPLVVSAVEAVFSPFVSRLLRLQTNLVRTQLSSNMWRSAGIAASLMLGLGLYTATQVWGWSMLGGFLPGRWTPNTIVKFSPALPAESLEKVKATPGIVSDSFLPIAVEQTKLVGDPLKSGDRDSAVRQDNVTLIGVDPHRAFGGNHPLFDMKFIEGNPADALEQLKQGRYCLVPETFRSIAGLGVGDRIGLIPPRNKEQPVDYTIAGVISMPGSNWITKTSGLRKQSVRTGGLVFASPEFVRKDFDLPEAEFLWFNAEPGVTKAHLEERLKPYATTEVRLPREGTERPTGAGRGRPGAAPSEGGAARRGGGPGGEPIQVTLLGDVRDGLRARGGDAIQAMGWLPLITLLVVSLGVVNTIAASVRARRWEFGILRAVGLTRWGLCRLVMSEALMVALVASLLSLAFGILTGWTCLGLVRYVSNAWFEGVATPFTIPWRQLAAGYGLCFLVCFLAALWPAISSGRAEPLNLLQAGRSAT